MLNKEEKNIGYLCGRLFAVLEYTQRKALGTSTFADKYLGAAMSSPAKVFTTLYKLSAHHLSKINSPRFEIYIKNIRFDITSKNPSFEFPTQLNLYEQGRFVVGYDHQMGDLYAHKDKDEENKVENDNN